MALSFIADKNSMTPQEKRSPFPKKLNIGEILTQLPGLTEVCEIPELLSPLSIASDGSPVSIHSGSPSPRRSFAEVARPKSLVNEEKGSSPAREPEPLPQAPKEPLAQAPKPDNLAKTTASLETTQAESELPSTPKASEFRQPFKSFKNQTPPQNQPIPLSNRFKALPQQIPTSEVKGDKSRGKRFRSPSISPSKSSSSSPSSSSPTTTAPSNKKLKSQTPTKNKQQKQPADMDTSSPQKTPPQITDNSNKQAEHTAGTTDKTSTKLPVRRALLSKPFPTPLMGIDLSQTLRQYRLNTQTAGEYKQERNGGKSYQRRPSSRQERPEKLERLDFTVRCSEGDKRPKRHSPTDTDQDTILSLLNRHLNYFDSSNKTLQTHLRKNNISLVAKNSAIPDEEITSEYDIPKDRFHSKHKKTINDEPPQEHCWIYFDPHPKNRTLSKKLRSMLNQGPVRLNAQLKGIRYDWTLSPTEVWTWGVIKGAPLPSGNDEREHFLKTSFLESNPQMLSIDRMGNFGTFKAKFRGDSLPPKVHSRSGAFRVERYIGRNQCQNCFQLGHHTKKCPQKLPTCARCAELGHKQADCTAPTKCALCQGEHTAFQRDTCPKAREQHEKKTDRINQLRQKNHGPIHTPPPNPPKNPPHTDQQTTKHNADTDRAPELLTLANRVAALERQTTDLESKTLATIEAKMKEIERNILSEITKTVTAKMTQLNKEALSSLDKINQDNQKVQKNYIELHEYLNTTVKDMLEKLPSKEDVGKLLKHQVNMINANSLCIKTLEKRIQSSSGAPGF